MTSYLIAVVSLTASDYELTQLVCPAIVCLLSSNVLLCLRIGLRYRWVDFLPRFEYRRLTSRSFPAFLYPLTLSATVYSIIFYRIHLHAVLIL